MSIEGYRSVFGSMIKRDVLCLMASHLALSDITVGSSFDRLCLHHYGLDGAFEVGTFVYGNP